MNPSVISDREQKLQQWKEARAWKIAIEFHSFHQIRKYFQLLKQLIIPTFTSSSSSTKVIQRIYLKSCFHRFHSRCIELKIQALRSLVLKRWIFRIWKSFRQYEMKENEIIAKFPMFYCVCFHWISLTLGQESPRYALPSKEDVLNPSMKKYYHRFRSYAIGRMFLVPAKLSLFIHAIAMLDSYQLHQSFRFWKQFYQNIKKFKT